MPLHRNLARVVDLYWARTEAPECALYSNIERAHAAARLLTRCFYVGLLLIAFRHLSLWDYYVGLRHIQPLWPVAWATLAPGRVAAVALLLFVLGSLLAVVYPNCIIARVFAFVGCLEFFAFLYSFGTVRHVDHLLILTTFMLIL